MSIELIANAPDAATFLQVAQITGFAANGQMLTQGDGWFLNYVGVSGARPGVWARLRLDNPDSSFFAFLTAVQSHGLTVYRQIADPAHAGALCWSSDGTTCAADQTIGLIGQMM